jgi:hypothetical protein
MALLVIALVARAIQLCGGTSRKGAGSMKSHRTTILAVLISAFIIGALIGPAGARRGAPDSDAGTGVAGTNRLAPSGAVASEGRLQMYEATVEGPILQQLVNQGYDVTPVEQTAGGTRVALVLSSGERKALSAAGVGLSLWRDGQGRTATERAALQAQNDFNVYRSFDEPGGIRDELYQIAADNPGLVKLEVLGQTEQGREYIALKLTQRARRIPDGARPAVLYVSTYHAREWISTEVNRRLLHWYVDQWNADNPEVKSLLESTELWFVVVHNPDGYEYTFDVERLWRKNLHDNDGDNEITNADGVDPNRNHAEHWNYDEEGSSSQFSSETYRGASANSENETQALVSLYDRVPFLFSISYHSFGQLLLYTQGWQVLTPSADDPIYMALTGDDRHPAVPGFNPGVGADLYTTNGEYTDWAHGSRGALAWTPELSEGCEGCGFVFPDDEALVQEEFEKNLQFALNVAKSADDPDDPESHWGVDTKGLYVNETELDPWKTNWPTSDLRVDVSYGGGSTQPVEVLAKRAIGPVTLSYRIDGGPALTALTTESPEGDVFGGNNGSYGTYYHYLRGEIPVQEGQTVEYWFTGGGESTRHTSFSVVEDADADVLILAAEDYSGASNWTPYPSSTSPNFLLSYQRAISESGRTFDVYDVDDMGRQAPDHLGVLSHYDSVVWYTGNDRVVREPGWGGGQVSRLAVDETLEVRQYLNEGGDLLYTGQGAGATENGVSGTQLYDPVANKPCFETPSVLNRCLVWSDKNDFLQYYLGAYIYNSFGGTDPGTGEPYPIEGVMDPYTGMSWGLNGTASAGNQVHTASFITTSSLLKPSDYPQFTSDARAAWDRGPGAAPFEPFDGQYYMYSQQADVTYKRLMRTIDVPGSGGEMTFQISYDTEPDWDFVFVEIHDVSADTWATAPDLNGHTSNSTGESCAEGWFELHPWLEQYQGSDCSGAGTSGPWNASSGRSQGWEEWRIDLTPYAGKQVEVSISYASDWAIQGLGSFVDQIVVPGGDGSTSFETGMDGWTVPGPPPGSDPNPNDWIRTQSVGFAEGAIVSETPSTADFRTLYFGFGFEAINGRTTRADVMDASLDFLGV